MSYISQSKTKGCIFCKIFRERKDAKNLILFRSKYFFVVFNTFPYTNGHVMVVSNRHIKDIDLLNDTELLDMNKCLIRVKKLLQKVIKPQGFNVGLNIGKVAGAGVEKHLHVHLVPRWLGDTNFMPVTSNTKIISQGLKDLYRECKKVLTK